jgi:hypothetical protein
MNLDFFHLHHPLTFSSIRFNHHSFNKFEKNLKL